MFSQRKGFKYIFESRHLLAKYKFLTMLIWWKLITHPLYNQVGIHQHSILCLSSRNIYSDFCHLLHWGTTQPYFINSLSRCNSKSSEVFRYPIPFDLNEKWAVKPTWIWKKQWSLLLRRGSNIPGAIPNKWVYSASWFLETKRTHWNTRSEDCRKAQMSA